MRSELQLLLLSKTKQESVKMINRSLLNKSPSKQLVFFSKAERFPVKKLSNSQQKEPSRQLRSHSSSSITRIQKFPTIPQAERVLYFDKEKQLCLHPSPQAYNVKSKEEIFKITHKGGTMGARFNSVPNLRQVTPSAVDYQKEIPPQKSFNRSFTFERSQRNLMKVLTKQGSDSPGPKYDTRNKIKQKTVLPSFQIKGEKKAQKPRNKGKRAKLGAIFDPNRFSTIHLQQFEHKQRSNEVAERTDRGHSIKRNVGFSTTRRERLQTLPQKNPGPGSYIFFSEFTGWM